MTRSLTHPMSVSDALVAFKDAQAEYHDRPSTIRDLLAMEPARRAAKPDRPERELAAPLTFRCYEQFRKVLAAGVDEIHAMLAALEEDERLMAEQRESTNPFLRPAHMPRPAQEG